MPQGSTPKVVTELILSARTGLLGKDAEEGFTFVFSLTLSTQRLVFRLSTERPVSVREVLESLGTAFGFTVPELPGIGPFRPWDALYNQRLTPALAFSPNSPRYIQGGMQLETPLQLGIPDLEVKGVRVRYQEAPAGGQAQWDFGVDVNLFGREQTLTYPFPVPQPKPPLLDLKYFGLGQRVAPDLQGAATMAAVMEKMRADLRQAPGDQLVERLAALYRPDAGWLAGLWLTVRDLVDLQVIFNDPLLFGVALRAGPKLGFLKGLAFEVLYQRISDEVGLFYIDLTLPVAVRELFMGAWSITLPSVALWIYTNGDFKVSLGWPLGEQSFTIQYLFLIGSGGFYLAKLSSATAPDVPAPPKGMTYDPVLAFGIALRLGVGREFHKGILSAVLTLSLYGVFEGRVAWQRATGERGLAAGPDPDRPLALAAGEAGGGSLAVFGAGPSVFDYFWFRGTFGIVGVIQGAVDFAIIKASVTVRLEASVTVTFETGRPTVIRVSAGVSVSLRVEVASFRIFGKRISIGVDLSFHADVSEEFVVDNDGVQMLLRQRMAREGALAWSALRLPWANLTPVLPLLFAPQVTRVDGVATFVATLTIPTEPVGGMEWSPFEALARAVAEWQAELHAHADGAAGPGRAQRVDRARLAVWGARLARSRYLNMADPSNPDPLTWEAIAAFLQANFILELDAPPPMREGEDPPPPVAGALFPMLPPLLLQVTGQLTVSFDHSERRDARYVRNLRAYFDEMRTAFAAPADRLLALAADDTGTPVARLVIEDYFAALIKGMRGELDRVTAERGGSLLLADALDEVDYASLAASVSRFLQAGLRPPDQPIGDDPASWPGLSLSALYEQTLQQFPVQLGAGEYAVALGIPDAFGAWIRPGPNGTRIAVAAEDAGAREALRALEALPLAAQVTNRRWLPPLAERPVRLTLKQLADWTDDAAAYVLAAVTAPLAALVPAEGVALRVAAAPWGDGGDPGALAWAPAVRVELTLTRVQRKRREGEVSGNGKVDAWVDNLYQLGGADERNRRVLERLLAAPGGLDGAALHLLYPAAGGAPGLRSRAVAASVLLVKTNLSTESNPQETGVLAARASDTDPVRAPLDDTRAFLTLAWQAGVVNTGGFYLFYAAADDKDLPDDLFDRDSSAPFTLLVTFPAAADARLRTWHNALVLDAGLARANEDGSGRTLYVEPQGVSEWDAAQPAGTLGFEVRRVNPNRTLAPPPSLALAVGPGEPGVTRSAILAAARAAGIAPGSAEEDALLQDVGDAAAQLQNLYNLLQFRILGRGRFQQSVWSVAVGPGEPDNAPDAARRFRALRTAPERDEPADWLYQQVPAVFRFAVEAAGQADPSRYAGVGGQVWLEFRVLDLFGNVLDEVDPVRLPRADVLFYDRLVAPDAWPGCALQYTLARNGDAAQLTIDIHFQPGAVVPAAMAGAAPDHTQAEMAAGARVAWGRIYDQLRDRETVAEARFSVVPDAPLPTDRAALAAFACGVRDWLGAIHPDEPWPALPAILLPLSWTVERPTAAGAAFPLQVELRLRRMGFVAPEAAEKNPQSAEVSSPVPPFLPASTGRAADATGERGPEGLQAFAREFENAFRGRLRVALGADADAQGERTATEQAGGELWAVRVGGPDGITVTPGTERHYFAPPPLSRHLASGTFKIRRYSDGTWTGEASDYVEADATFTQVDLDAWANSFLAGVDAFLAPALAMPVARLAPERFTELMGYKETIAGAIAGSVVPVFDPDRTPGGAGDVEAAREGMYQRLLIRLATAYEVDTIVQLPVTMQVPAAAPGETGELGYYGVVNAVPAQRVRDGDTDAAEAQFSGARLSLAPAPAGGTDSFSRSLTFLFTAAHPTERRSFAGRLRWTVGYVERRGGSPASEGERRYRPSSWLRFVRTDPSVELALDLGGFDVPIAIRRFPDPPDLVRQTAEPAYDPPATLAEALRWTFCLKLRQRDVAQDRLVVDADYNVPEAPPSLATTLHAGGGERPPPQSLFEALARYTAEAGSVLTRTGAVAAAANGQETRAEALAVIDRFADLVRGVALQWQRHVVLAANVLGSITDSYWVEKEEDDGVLRVRRLQAPTELPVWPEIDGYAADPVEPTAETRTYRRVLELMAARFGAAEVERAFRFPGLRLAERQNGRGGARVVRNASLGEWETNPAFVYETAPVRFENPVTPMVAASGISLDPLAGDTLAAKLASFFEAVFEPAQAAPPGSPEALRVGPGKRLIRLEVGYRFSFATAGEGPPMPVMLPLLLVDDYEFQVDSDGDPAVQGAFARQLVEALSDWHGRERPAGTDAALTFGLVVFSNFSAVKLPLLRLESLTLSAPADDVWWVIPALR